MKLVKVKKTETVRRTKWNTDKLKIVEVQQYQLNVENKLREEEVPRGIKDKWKTIERAIREATGESVGIRRDRNEEWFDEDCRLATEEKTCCEKENVTETQNNCKRYRELRRRAHRICKRKKKRLG